MIEGKEVLGRVEGGGERRIGVGEEEEIKLPHRHIGPHRNLHFIPFQNSFYNGCPRAYKSLTNSKFKIPKVWRITRGSWWICGGGLG